MLLIFIKFAVLLNLFVTICGDPLVIETNKGSVKGVTITADNGKDVDAWYSIPYAKPPLGTLRFRTPVENSRWTDVKDTSKLPNSCYQNKDTTFGKDFWGTSKRNPNTPMSEDCLYLTIVVPKPRPTNASVLVWIYGGGFRAGTSTLARYNYETLASEENVIVAAMQYRLGPLGFLYLGMENAPGNVGLFDQQMALKWIHENIEHFGGNKSSITIFGESAGSASVGMQLLSTDSSNYFSKGIMESGSPLGYWATSTTETAIERAMLLAAKLNCSICNTENNKMVTNDTFPCPNGMSSPKSLRLTIDCLTSQNPEDLVKMQATYHLPILEIVFLPIADGTFFQKNITELMKSSSFKNASLLIGSVSQEASLFLMEYWPSLFTLEENVTLTKDQFDDTLIKLYPNSSSLVKAAIKYEYTPWSNIDDGQMNRDAIVKLVGDHGLVCSGIEFAQYYANAGNDVYMYLFSHRSWKNPWPQWAGAIHSEEIEYVFGDTENLKREGPDSYTEKEKKLSKSVMRKWANFARTGDPNLNEDGTRIKPEWPLYTKENQEYLVLDTEDTGTKKGLRAKECALWNYLIPQIKRFEENAKGCNK